MLIILATPIAGLAATRLNSLVVELVNTSPAAGEHGFELAAHDGWVFIRVTGGGDCQVRLSGVETSIPLHAGPVAGTREAMRQIKAGRHRITVRGDGLERLQVRRVPEIVFNKYQYDPWVVPEGPFDWEFLEKHVLPHVNTICGMRGQDQRDRSDPWRAAGGRWIVETLAPGLRASAAEQAALTPETIVDDLLKQIDLSGASLDGVLVDEYYPSLKALFAPTIQAIERIHADPAHKGKRVDLYVAGTPKEMAEFLSGGVRAGARLAFEAYNCEQPTEAEAIAYLKRRLPDRMREYAAIVPGGARHITVCPGMYDAPPESVNTYPQVNYRVFQDMEFQLMAGDPAFEDLFGIMAYTCGYSEADTVRWLGRLYRHYCIEGRTERLSSEPYILPYIKNPDFADGLLEWMSEPAEEGSIGVRTMKDLGSLQARMGSGAAGDKCLLMKRSGQRPNRVRQQIQHLEPGRAYTLRMYSTNPSQRETGYANPTADEVHTVWVQLDGVEALPARSYRHTYRSIHTSKSMYFNYHVHRFRAKGPRAEVVISDWESAERRTGAPGREAVFNFVEIQPCLPD